MKKVLLWVFGSYSLLDLSLATQQSTKASGKKSFWAALTTAIVFKKESRSVSPDSVATSSFEKTISFSDSLDSQKTSDIHKQQSQLSLTQPSSCQQPHVSLDMPIFDNLQPAEETFGHFIHVPDSPKVSGVRSDSFDHVSKLSRYKGLSASSSFGSTTSSYAELKEIEITSNQRKMSIGSSQLHPVPTPSPYMISPTDHMVPTPSPFSPPSSPTQR